MSFFMPPETAPQERIWMSFPKAWAEAKESEADREGAYRAWTEVARAIAEFEPVTMIVDPSETARAHRMLGTGIEQVVRVIDYYWLRDNGPTFVHAADGSLAAVDWIFNAWGGNYTTGYQNDRGLAAFVAGLVRAYCGQSGSTDWPQYATLTTSCLSWIAFNLNQIEGNPH